MDLILSSGIYPGKPGCSLSDQIAVLKRLDIRCVEPFLFWKTEDQEEFFYRESDRPRIAELYKLLVSSGLKTVSYHGQYGPNFAMVLFEEEGRELALANIRNDMQVAKLLGVSQMVIHAGTGPRGQYVDRRTSRLRLLTDALIELSRTAEKLHLRLAVENMPHGICDNVEELVSVIKEVDSSYIGICLDIGHANLNGDPIESLRICGPHLFSIHLHDNNGQADEHRFPFTGTTDEKRFIAELAHSGFTGPVVLEVNEFWNIDEDNIEEMRGSLIRLKQFIIGV